MAGSAYQEIKELIAFQELDLETDNKKRRLSEIPQEIQELDNEIERFHAEKDKVNLMIEEQERNRRLKEQLLESNVDKLAKYQTQLYSLKTNKEYQAMLSEIDGLKAENEQIEEEIIIMMEETEQLKTRKQQAENDFQRKAKEFKQQISLKEKEQKELLNRLEELHNLKETKKNLIDPKLLRNYEKLRMNLGFGKAIAPIIDGTCQGCYIALRPQYVFEIKTSDGIFYCESCHRIIYLPEIINPGN